MQESDDITPPIPSGEEAATLQRVNRVPASAVLAGLLVWAVFRLFLRDIVRVPHDVVDVVWGILIAMLGVSSVPFVMALTEHDLSYRQRRVVAGSVCALFAVPLVLALFWSARDVLHPVAVRDKGGIPNLVGLLGANQRDAERMLGDKIRVRAQAAGGSGRALVPRDIGAVRYAVYALPDLNRLSQRPAKQSQLGGASRGGSSLLAFFPGGFKSDASVAVYYSSAGKVVGARLEVSRVAARDILAAVTTSNVLSASGVDGAAGGAGSASQVASPSVATASVEASASGTRNVTGERSIDYYVRLDGMPGVALDLQPAGNAPTDPGDVVVFVSLTPEGWAQESPEPVADAEPRSSSAPSSTGGGNAGTSRDSKPAPPVGWSSHSDERFWVIVCSEVSTEEAAREAAARLNARWVSPPNGEPSAFTVERSGHLQWLGTRDYWLVIYDVAFAEEGPAKDQISKMGLPLRLEAKALQVTKVCGDRTIARVVP